MNSRYSPRVTRFAVKLGDVQGVVYFVAVDVHDAFSVDTSVLQDLQDFVVGLQLPVPAHGPLDGAELAVDRAVVVQSIQEDIGNVLPEVVR